MNTSDETPLECLCHSVSTWPVEIHFDLFEQYTAGYSVQDCVDAYHSNFSSSEDDDDALSLRQEYVSDQFRLFDFLVEELLHSPLCFVTAQGLPLSFEDRLRLVELYYALDHEQLGRLWFGDRHCDEEEDHEANSTGLHKSSLKRQWKNLKRISKVIIGGYKERDGRRIPTSTPLAQAISHIFVLPMSMASRFSTLVFGFEHKLDCSISAEFSFEQCATMCNALGLWCDGSELLLSDDFCQGLKVVKGVLAEARVMQELYVRIFSEPFVTKFAQVVEGVHQRVVKPSKAPSCPHNPTNTLNNNSVSCTPQAISSDTSILNSSRKSQEVTAIGVASSFTQVPAKISVTSPTITAAATVVSSSRIFSRRFCSEFPHFVKVLCSLCRILSTKYSMVEALQLFYQRLVRPILCEVPHVQVGLNTTSGVPPTPNTMSNSAPRSPSSVHQVQGDTPSTLPSTATTIVNNSSVTSLKEKRLRELSNALGLVRQMYLKLTALSEDDHRASDGPLLNLVDALRIILQLTTAVECA